MNPLSLQAIADTHAKLIQALTGERDDADELIEAVELGKIALVRVVYNSASFEELAGDAFDSEINDNISPAQLRREAREFKTRIQQDGTWTYVSQYWDGRNWEWLKGIQDNITGVFVGDDFFRSGDVTGLMQMALDAYNRQTLDSNGFVIDPYRLNAGPAP